MGWCCPPLLALPEEEEPLLLLPSAPRGDDRMELASSACEARSAMEEEVDESVVVELRPGPTASRPVAEARLPLLLLRLAVSLSNDRLRLTHHRQTPQAAEQQLSQDDEPAGPVGGGRQEEVVRGIIIIMRRGGGRSRGPTCVVARW